MKKLLIAVSMMLIVGCSNSNTTKANHTANEVLEIFMAKDPLVFDEDVYFIELSEGNVILNVGGEDNKPNAFFYYIDDTTYAISNFMIEDTNEKEAYSIEYDDYFCKLDKNFKIIKQASGEPCGNDEITKAKQLKEIYDKELEVLDLKSDDIYEFVNNYVK